MSTIDPGVDGNIKSAANEIQGTLSSSRDEEKDAEDVIDEEQEEQEERHFLDPSRWWFASTASPLIAGTFGPMASAFNLCALVVKWRVYIPPGHVNEDFGTPVSDPVWLVAVNAVSLVCALVANFSLLLNMARRVSFAVAQPITVIGFYLASFLLIVLVSIGSSDMFRLKPYSHHALSQAYYYAVFAAALYAVIAILMTITVWGAYRGHYSKEFQLTLSQRTLMLQTIAFMFYLLLGALIYSKVEGWQYLDAVYFVDFTLLTIGIGDFYVPKTHLGRSLLLPFAVGGIVTLGLVISSIRTMVLESGGQKLGARITEKKREAVLASADFDKGSYRISIFALRHFNPDDDLKESHKRQQQFHAMRQIIQRADRKRRYTSLAISVGVTCALWFGGAAIYQQTETAQNFSYFESVYFTYTSLLTIGYGDLSPQSNSGRPFFVFWSLLSVPALTVLISDLGDTLVKGVADFTNWVGAFTILPGEEGARNSIKRYLQKFTTSKVLHLRKLSIKQPGNFLPSKDGKRKHKLHYGDIDDVLLTRLKEEDVAKAARAAKDMDADDSDRQFYNYLLINEIRKVLGDVDADPPKQYSYDEWAYYLRLLGQDENDSSLHSAPHIKPEIVDGSYRTYIDLAKDIDHGREVPTWSWLGAMSPLMSDKSEAEWILHRLMVRLQRQLSPATAAPITQPPMSLSAALTKRGKVGKSANDGDTNGDDDDGSRGSTPSGSGGGSGSDSRGESSSKKEV